MTKETRANLLFLTVFLVISLPGAVILFKKKLDPAVPPSYMPDVARRTLPYNAPADAPDLPRYVPDATGRWVAELAKRHGVESVLRRGGLPVMSDQRMWQLMDVRPGGQGMKIDLLLWGAADSTLDLTGVQGDGRFIGRVDARQEEAVPEAVRKELIYGGYPKPPKAVTWVAVTVEGLKERKPGTLLRVRQRDALGELDDSVTLFTD